MRPLSSLLMAASLVALTACNSPSTPPLSEETYRAFKRINGAKAMGVSKVSYDNLLQEAATALLVLGDLAPKSSDTIVHRLYSEALEVYRDAGTVWAEEIDNGRHEWIPAGRIYVTFPDIVSRYKLPTTKHKVTFSSTEFETVGNESIQSIWKAATPFVDSADALVIPKLLKGHDW